MSIFGGTSTSTSSAYNSITGANRSEEIDPISLHYLGETIADITNGTASTTYYYVDMTGFQGFTAQLDVAAATATSTITFEATCQDDGTVAASCSYQDITQYGLDIETAGSTAASYSADATLTLSRGSNYKYIRAKVVIAGGADATLAIYTKKWY